MDNASLERDFQCMLCTIRFFLIGPDARPNTLETWPFPIVVKRTDGTHAHVHGGPVWTLCGTCHRLATQNDLEALKSHVHAMMTTLQRDAMPAAWPGILTFLEAWWQNYQNAKLTPQQLRLRRLALMSKN